MFTPPPSPLPGQRHEIKARISRRFRWTAIFGPLLLVLITVSTRYITHPALFDALSGESTHSVWSPHKRHLDPRDSSNSSLPISTTTTPTSTTTLAQPVPTVPTSAAVPTPFPQPFDGNMPQNFSSTACFNFFSNMTAADPFRSCRPLSLLLQTSSVLVQAQKNLTLLNSIIWGTCQTTLSFQQCSANMAWFANALQSTCAQDITENNTNVVSTLAGLQAFDLMYQVGCLADPSTNSYCYLNAVQNSNPSDIYLYQLPVGLAYPNTSTPTCSTCAKNVMTDYFNALQNTSTSSALSTLKSNYPSAEQDLVAGCGTNFAKSLSNAADRPILARGSIAVIAFLILFL